MKEGKEKSMGITYFEKERIFKLDTKNTSYLIGITDEENFIGHIYYGKNWRIIIWHICSEQKNPPMCLR